MSSGDESIHNSDNRNEVPTQAEVANYQQYTQQQQHHQQQQQQQQQQQPLPVPVPPTQPTFYYQHNDQEIVYPNINYYPYSQFVPIQHHQQRQELYDPPAPSRRNALQPDKIYRHKRPTDNLSISTGLNTIHIKENSSNDEEEGVEESSKKIKLDIKSILKDSEIALRDRAIESIRTRVQIDQFAAQLQITRPEIAAFQDTKPSVKQLQERERNRNIFAIRCLFECCSSPDQQDLNVIDFQSKLLIDALNLVQKPNLQPTSSIQQSKAANSFIATARSVIYSSYSLLCEMCNVDTLGQSGIGKVTRIAFPGITTKRLGTRGNSKYHYVGISSKPWIKELAELYDSGKLILPKARTTSKRESEPITHQENEIFDLDFGFFVRETDPMISNFFQKLASDNLFQIVEFINSVTDLIDFQTLYSRTLQYLNPLSYQLGENSLLNSLNYLNLLTLERFEQFGEEAVEKTKRFIVCVDRLVKSSRCSLSVSNLLFLYHRELLYDLQNLNLTDIINLEIDDVMERFLFFDFFKNFEDFLITIPSLITITGHEVQEAEDIHISSLFSTYNKIIMRNFVQFLIVEIRKFQTQNLKVLILNFSKIITSINDEILRDEDTNMNFNNWWIFNCWLNEWLNYCCESIAFKQDR